MFLLDVIKDYWVLFLLGILLLLVFRFLFKAVFRIVMVLVLIGFVAIFVFGKPADDVIATGKRATEIVTDSLQKLVIPAIQKEMGAATYSFQPDGTYEVRMDHVRIVGKKGDPTATVYYDDHSYQMNINDLDPAIQKKIQEAQNAN